MDSGDLLFHFRTLQQIFLRLPQPFLKGWWQTAPALSPAVFQNPCRVHYKMTAFPYAAIQDWSCLKTISHFPDPSFASPAILSARQMIIHSLYTGIIKCLFVLILS